jgi:aminoacrylate hydrolase
MATFNMQGISQYYEVHGDAANPPVLLVSGLGGVGASWGPQIKRFSESYYVILPDQRGTGQTTHALDGYTTRQLATDMASLIDHLGLGPVHVVGSSTGGAIVQHLALDHPQVVRSLTITSSFARFDAFMRREFEIRRKMATEWDRHTLLSAYSLFLFSPRFTHDHPERVSEWIERATASGAEPRDRDVELKRIDMIAAHDQLARLGQIQQPTLVTCGDHNFCTPLALSEEIARAVRGAEFVIFEDAGELIEIEKEDDFFRTVSSFIERHRNPLDRSSADRQETTSTSSAPREAS